MQNTALIAMSGGVDSSAAAWLTLQEGFDCAGAMMKLFPGDEDALTKDARNAAEKLGIPFHLFDYSDCFARNVIDRFIRTYREGKTPNPCIDCNKRLKFGELLRGSAELKRDFVVTGHYARLEFEPGSGRYLLKRGADLSKDQSYVLYTLSQEQLSRARFPLGGLSKPEVREIAAAAGFDSAGKAESQDICFIPDGDYVGFIERYTGEPAQRGRFVGEDGGFLGENRGIIAYTVGQRRGLGLAMPYPAYVLELRPAENAVVVGRSERLFSKTLSLRDINLIPLASLSSTVEAQVKIRYNHKEQPATVRQTGSDELLIEFRRPQRAITSGQSAVIYDGDIVIGGGIIV